MRYGTLFVMHIPTEGGDPFEDPFEESGGEPYRHMTFDTLPTTFVRDGWPDTPEPYDRVVGLADGMYDSGLHPDALTPEAREQLGHRELSLQQQMAARLADYYRTYQADGPDERAETNCAHFVCEVAGIEYEGELPWQGANISLDEAIHPENEWDETQPIPLGAVAVLGTYEHKPVRVTSSRLTHAAIGTGTPLVLQVTARGGYLGFRDQAEMIATLRQEIIPDGYAPEDVRVFILPRRAYESPAEDQ